MLEPHLDCACFIFKFEQEATFRVFGNQKTFGFIWDKMKLCLFSDAYFLICHGHFEEARLHFES